MDAEVWEPGVPLYRNPRHVFDGPFDQLQIVRNLFDLFEDHNDECYFCRNGRNRKSMTVTFEKEAKAA